MSTSVASVVSHFPDAENGFTTTLASTISSGATTVPLNSVSGYTNGEPIVLVVDPSDVTKKQTFTGIIDTAGIQITSVVWTAGTNQTHSGGATVVDYPAATHMAMVSKGIKVNHTQKGNHKTLTDDNANEWIAQTSTASAVNELTVANAATGTSPTLSATGGDTNVDLKLVGKGTGKAYADSIGEYGSDIIVSGCVWTADSAGVNRNASMTAGYVYIGGVRVTVAAVTARTFTASKDTYIDVTTAGVVTYAESTNGAAAQALTAGSIRLGYIITAAGSIAATTSIKQNGKDSLGNLMYNRSHQAARTLVKARQGGASGDATWLTPGTTYTDVGNKSVFVQVGSVTMSTGAGGDAVVTFPTPYTFAPLVFAMPQTAVSVNQIAGINTVTTTGFNMRTTSAGGAGETGAWIAIGQ